MVSQKKSLLGLTGAIMTVLLSACQMDLEVRDLSSGSNGAFHVQFETTELQLSEGGAAVVAITLSEKRTVATTVLLQSSSSLTASLGGSDFTGLSPQVVIPAGSLTTTLSFSIKDDLIFEGPEVHTISLSVSDPTISVHNNQLQIQVADNDPQPTLSFDKDSQSILENGGGGSIVAVLSHPSTQEITANLSLALTGATAGVDFSFSHSSVSFSPISTSQSLNYSVSDDGDTEGLEKFDVSLGAVTAGAAILGSPLNHEVMILDNESVLLSVNDVSVVEGNQLQFTVSLSTTSASTVGFNWQTEDITALAGTHYVAASGAGSIAIGNSTTTITVNSIDFAGFCDPDFEFRVRLSSPSNAALGDDIGTGTIVDDDVPHLILSSDTTTEGGVLNFQATVSQLCSQDISFEWFTAQNTATPAQDYVNAAETVVIPANTWSSQQFSVSTVDDTLSETTEKLFIALRDLEHAKVEGASFGVGTIIDNEVSVKTTKTASGEDFTCALSSDNRIKCWGSNMYGELGTGGINRGDDPGELGANWPKIDLGPGRTVKKAAIGESHACAILDNDRLKCWGKNNSGELGLGDSENRGDNPGEMGGALPYVDLGTSDGVTPHTALDVAVGDSYSCAILDDGRVKCWGYGDGTGRGSQEGSGSSDMGDNLAYTDLGTGLTAKKIFAAYDRTCVILNDDTVKCWGDAYGGAGLLGYGSVYGDVDDPSKMGNALPAVALGTGVTVKGMALGWHHTCVIAQNDRAKCWGSGDDGRLFNGSQESYNTAAEMGDTLPYLDLGTSDGTTPLRVLKMTAGEDHSCALLEVPSGFDGVKCWGQGAYLGYETTADQGDAGSELGDNLPFVDLGVAADVVDIGGNSTSTCALFSTGQVRCWGEGHYGQLGNADESFVGSTPGTMGSFLVDLDTGSNPPQNLLQATAVASGNHIRHTNCYLSTGGDLRCWGSHGQGILGEGNLYVGDASGEMGVNLQPVALESGFVPINIVAGGAHACALSDAGEVKCWGNYRGAGSGRDDDNGDRQGELASSAPIDFGAGRTAVAIFSGGPQEANCAILDNFDLKCWGDNDAAMLGNGTGAGDILGDESSDFGDNLPVTPLGTGLRAIDVAIGYANMCALVQTGQVKCWGSRHNGGLGYPATESIGDSLAEMGDNLPFVDLGSGLRVAAVDAGHNAFCVASDDGQVKCWGRNDDGKLGLEDTNHRGDDIGEMGDSLSFVNLGGRSALRLEMTSAFTCVTFSSQETTCWGEGDGGHLGGIDEDRGGAVGDMGANLHLIDVGTGRYVLSTSQGESAWNNNTHFTCGLLDNQDLKCWGGNTNGTLGYDDRVSRGLTAVEMGDALPVVELGW